MKKIIIALAVVLFTINVGAQETNPAAKKESCNKKGMTAEEKEKCEAKCKAEGKKCTAEDKSKKSCCSKK